MLDSTRICYRLDLGLVMRIWPQILNNYFACHLHSVPTSLRIFLALIGEFPSGIRSVQSCFPRTKGYLRSIRIAWNRHFPRVIS